MFAERLRELRRAADLTQSQLAEALGFAQTTIATYERGVKEPGREVIIAVAKYFGVSTDYLLGLTDDKNALAVVVRGEDIPKVLRDVGAMAAIASKEALESLSDEDLQRIAFQALKAIEDRKGQ